MRKMNVDIDQFLYLAVRTSLCDLSDSDRLELAGEWNVCTIMVTILSITHITCSYFLSRITH